MFQEHPNVSAPAGSTMLWRYLDLAKLLFLLEHRALWFSRLDTLGDPYEGLPPRVFIDRMWGDVGGATAFCDFLITSSVRTNRRKARAAGSLASRRMVASHGDLPL